MTTRPLTAAQLGELLGELAPLVEGTIVKDVQAQPPRDVLLILEASEAPNLRRLRISADPDACRVHLQLGRVQRHKGPEGPFYRALHELEGAKLVRASQVRGDRICALDFRGGAAGADRTLFCELTGRHANLAFADGDATVLAVLVAPPKKRADSPRLSEGAAWVAPPGRAGARDGEPSIVEALPEPGEEAPEPLGPLAPLSWRVERALGGGADERDLGRDRRDLRERLKRKLKRAEAGLAGLEKRRTAAEGAQRVRQDGELLTSALGTLKRGMREVVLADWFEDGIERRIELDPKLSPKDNAERYFQRYRKLERQNETLAEELARAEGRRDAIAAALSRVDTLDSDGLAELEADAVKRGLLDRRQEADPRKRKAPPPRLSYRSFTGSRGSEIRVGRSAKDNDRLSLRDSRGNDLWLHTRDTPGSHVVLRVERGQDPHEDEVLDAAHLAVHFSPLKGATRAVLHVARCKEVKKPKGAPAGLVTLSGGKTLQLRVEPERLRRLLDRRRDAGNAAAGGEQAGA